MTRGDDIRLERGSTVNMVFERPVTIEASKLGGNGDYATDHPALQNRR